MGSPRLESLQVTNYRSIGATPVFLRFPQHGPLVVLGENNAGKSNISRCIDLLFGERWPSTFQPEPHDFHGRDPDGIAIKIGAEISGFECECGGEVTYIELEYDISRNDGDPCKYSRRCDSCRKTMVSKRLRSQLFCMLIGADRGLSYQLSYASKFTLLSKLMHRFHTALLSDFSRKERLSSIFNSLLEQFDGVHEFSEFRSALTEMSEELAGNLSYRLDIDFSAYDPSNFFRSLRVHPTLSGEVRSFDELGSGQAEILALSFAYAYAKAFGQQSSLLLIIDEPESHLHPIAQQWLADRLTRLSTNGLQVVITTHSPHFVDLSRPENLVLVRRENGSNTATTVTQLTRENFAQELILRGSHPGRTTPDSVGEFYASGATTEITSGIFAKACVIVEGRTESLSLPELLRLVGFDPLRYGIAFIPVDGVANLAKWHRFYELLGIPVYPILDTDNNDKSNLAARKDLMRAIGHNVAEAVNMPTEPLFVRDRYAAFSPNFEDAMKVALGARWDQLADIAQQQVGPNKPLIARYVARKLTLDDLSDSLRSALDALSKKLASLTPGVTVPRPRTDAASTIRVKETSGFDLSEEFPF